jgi:hypothetical protein
VAASNTDTVSPAKSTNKLSPPACDCRIVTAMSSRHST